REHQGVDAWLLTEQSGRLVEVPGRSQGQRPHEATGRLLPHGQPAPEVQGLPGGGVEIPHGSAGNPDGPDGVNATPWSWPWQPTGNFQAIWPVLPSCESGWSYYDVIPASGRRREDTAVVVRANKAVANTLLRRAREALNLTQDEVAEGLVQLGAKGTTGGLVSKWERGI